MDSKVTVLMGLLLVGLSLSLSAQEWSPETFVRADIEARQATLTGMQARLTALQQGASREVQAQLAADHRAAVEAVFHQYGITGLGHTTYGTRHREAIMAWLEDHPDWQTTYADLTARFKTLAEQLERLGGGN